MKSLRLYLITALAALVTLGGTMTISAVKEKGAEPNFQISDEELKALNLDPKEAEELRSFFDELNKLTPEQKQELEELGRATEERMKQQNLDPNNLDDLMKFMETEGLTEQQPPKVPVKADKPKPQPAPSLPAPHKATDKPDIVAIASSTDTLTMINDIIHHLGSLRQKAITIPALTKKLDSIENEIAQLSFYLNVLRSPDLLKLLTSKDFTRLHGTLEKLDASFKTFEPSISAKKRSEVLNTDDPYEVLELPYNATDEEIKARHAELVASRSPEAVLKQLKQEGCDDKACKQMTKAAERTFALIQSSYEALTKNRAAVDQHLRDKIAKETRKEATSLRAFDNLFAAITSAISREQLLQQTHQLLEKYKPEELKQMKAQVELEKKVYESSKKRITVPQARPSQKPQGSPYDSFYKKMGQQRPPTPRPGYKPAPSSGKGGTSEGKEKKGGGGPGKDGKKDAGKKPEGKKDGGKKDDGKKPDKKDDGKKAPGPLTKEDKDRMLAINNLGGLFDTAKKQKDIEVTFKPRNPGDEPMTDKQKLSQIVNRLDDELVAGTLANQEAAQHLKQYFDKLKLEDIEKALKKAAPGKGKKLSGDLAKDWTDNVAKNKELIKEWYDTVAMPLDILERRSLNKRKIPEAKLKHHGLHFNDIDPWYKPKEGEEAPKRELSKDAVDLGKIRSSIIAINTYVKETGTN